MLSPDAQRPPGGAATTVPSPASEDNADRSDDHRRRADVASADNYSAARLAEHLSASDRAAETLTLHVDPEAAAEDLRAAVGGRAAAYRWAVALIAEVGR